VVTHHPETPWRPRLHFTPPKGWLNDPNGLVTLGGEHHLFYQHHPDADVWGPMHWGHAVSADLVRWEHLPIALWPDVHGWIYSGSAVVDADGTAGFGAGALVAVFTHADAEGQSQSLAWSGDRGRTWEAFDGNPVLEAPEGEADFRDPRVLRWEGGGAGHWVMVLAAGRRVLLYTSTDLHGWEPASELSPTLPGGEEVTWETPDLFPLRIEGTGEERWVLTVAAMSGAPAGGGGTCYLVGSFDGRTFAPESTEPVWADHGPDFYAPQSWGGDVGGERVWVGWMGDWSYAQEVPSSGWRGVMSLPRRLGLVETAEGARLTQRPVAAVDDLLVPLVTFGPGTVVGTRIGADRAAALGVLHLECFDLVVDLEVGPRSQGCLEIRAATHADEHVSVTYDTEHRTLSLDRSRAGPAPFHRTHGGRAVVGLEPEDGIVRLRVVGDTCTTEVFGNDGRAAMSALTYPSRPGCGIHLAASRGPLKYRSVELRGRPVHRVL
jgi:sucrose-6-phosphate hydrolase SacC (GH32 family)